MSDEEWVQLEQLAMATGYAGRSAYARDRLLGEPPVLWVSCRRDLVKAIGRVVVLLDQLPRDPRVVETLRRLGDVRLHLLESLVKALRGSRSVSWGE